MSYLEHLGEGDADGDQGREEHEEVGDLRGGVTVEEAAQVYLVLKGDRVEDHGLDDDLQLGLYQGFDVGDLVLVHPLLLFEVPFHQTRTNQEKSERDEFHASSLLMLIYKYLSSRSMDIS